ncbi:MAG: response regulator, partial [Calditrichia bacterium]
MKIWKLLVVDDQPEITRNIETFLQGSPYQIRLANNAVEGRFMIEHYNFDIAILDIMLPDGDGIDLYRALHQKNPEIYTLM